MKNDKEAIILVLVKVEGNVAKAADIRSKTPTQAYRDNFDLVFGSKEKSALN